jgi:hypothetical protein
LTADAGAEGAVQVQFVTKRGTNDVHWQVFDQLRHDALNSNTWLNSVRGLPKNKLRLNEWGGNVGGPLVRGKLFYFVNFEQPIQPSEVTFTRTVLTSEAQQGLFRYSATDGSTRTVNFLDIARANGFPSAIDPFIASQFATINRSLSGGTLRSTDLLRQELAFAVPQKPTQVYPTSRVDWQAAPGLAVRGILNLWWRDLARNPQFPNLDFVNAGFTSTYFILSTGADWTMRPNLFNQISFGIQSNHGEFNPGNEIGVYGGARRVAFPLTLTTALPTNDVMPMPRNNPVYNVIDTVHAAEGAAHLHARRKLPADDSLGDDRRRGGGRPDVQPGRRRRRPGLGNLQCVDHSGGPDGGPRERAVAVRDADRAHQRHHRHQQHRREHASVRRRAEDRAGSPERLGTLWAGSVAGHAAIHAQLWPPLGVHRPDAQHQRHLRESDH